MVDVLSTVGVAALGGLITGLITWGGLKKDVEWIKVLLVQHENRLQAVERK